MNWRHLLGVALSSPLDRLLRWRRFPLLRTFQLRNNWLYDACRYANTRDFRMLFDVGANVGLTCHDLTGFFPRATIHAFEPANATFQALCHNLVRRPNVHPHRLALGSKPEHRELVLQDNPLLNSLALAEPLAEREPRRTEAIEVTTVDAFCRTQGIEFIDILKIDAQGFDLEVLRGSESMTTTNRIAFILVEVSFHPGDRINSPFMPIHELLLARDFRLSAFYDQVGLGHRNSVLWFANALYAHPMALADRFASPRIPNPAEPARSPS